MKTHRYNCRNVRNMLPLHVGRDLDPRHVPAVDEHLRRCLSCFREFRDLASVRGRLGVLAEETLPAGILDGFTEEVMARIAVGEPGPAAPVLRLHTAWWNRPALRGAAALLLVCLAAWRWFDGRPVTPPPQQDGGLVAADVERPAVPTGHAPPQVLNAPLTFPMGRAQPASVGARPATAGVPGQPTGHGLILWIPGARLPSPTDAMLLEQGGEPVRAALPAAGALGEGLLLDESGRQRRPRQP